MGLGAVEPELIADYECQTGEGPLWQPEEGALYWLDIPRGRMFRYFPVTGRHEPVYQGEPIGGSTLQADGALLLFMARGQVAVWRDGTLEPVIPELAAERDGRFNDVGADPEGRVFCGTITTENHAGRLYRLDPDASLTLLLEGLGTPNGIGFTPDLRQMYFTDTRAYTIYLFDYDRATGAITNQRPWVQVPKQEGEGRPDGLTVDAEGCVWSARWDGGCVVRYSPEGEEIGRVRFPAKKVSCPAFGGEDLSDLYVTTAGGDNRAENGPGAGALFRIRPGVKGVPEFRSRIRL